MGASTGLKKKEDKMGSKMERESKKGGDWSKAEAKELPMGGVHEALGLLEDSGGASLQ